MPYIDYSALNDALAPVAMEVKKDKPGPDTVTYLPHVKKVIEKAPPEYIVLVVVAFLHLFAITISIVHILHKHRAYIRLRPKMVYPTIAILTFYWFFAAANMIGMIILRANLLCQAISTTYDALISYLFAVLCIAYANGKVSYFAVTKWRDVSVDSYSCSTLCCWRRVEQADANRGMSYIVQYIVINCLTCMVELIAESEEVYFYPSPITKSYLLLALKAVQFISLLLSLYGFLMFCRSASIVSPRTSPYTKLILFKCIYVLSVTQNNLLVYLAFVGYIEPLGSLTNITRSVVWGNFGTVVECTLMYFIAARLYKIEDYNHHSLVKEPHFGKADLPEGTSQAPQYTVSKTPAYSDNGALEHYSEPDSMSDEERGVGCEIERKINSSINDKLQNLTIKLVSDNDREQYHKLAYSDDSDECSVSNTSRVEGMFGPVKGGRGDALKRIRLAESEQDQVSMRSYSGSTRASIRSSRCDVASVRSSRGDMREEEPRIRIVGGKLNISLSTKDIALLTKCEEGDEEVVRRCDRRKRRTRSRNSMQFLKLSKYNTLEDEEEEREGTLTYGDQVQETKVYDDRDATLKYEDKDATLKFDEHEVVNTSIEDYDFNPEAIERTSSVSSVSGKTQYVSKISLV